MRKNKYMAPALWVVELEVEDSMLVTMSTTDSEVTDETSILSTGSDGDSGMGWKSSIWDEEE